MIAASDSKVKTSVSFNRRSGRWIARNGQGFSFGPGYDNKRLALRLALNHDHPRLGALVSFIARCHNNDIHLVDRLLKAASLLAKGQVWTAGPNRWTVLSQGDGETRYSVIYSQGGYSCNCVDFENGLKRQAGEANRGGADVNFDDAPICKHALAVHLAFIGKIALESEEIPF